MKRLSLAQKNGIIKMLLKGRSLNKISEISSLSKTTIYYYMRQKLGRKYSLVSLKREDLELIGEVVGFFAGDGNIFHDIKKGQWHVRFSFNRKEKRVISHYLNSLKSFTNKTPFKYDNDSVTILYYNSKELSRFFSEYLEWYGKKGNTVRLRDKKFLREKRFLIGFLRGLTDSDGYVRRNRKEIYFGSVSERLSNDFIGGLEILNLKSKKYVQKRSCCLDFNKVRLSGKDVDKFISIIRPVKALQNASTRN